MTSTNSPASNITRTAAAAPRARVLVLLDPRGAFTAVAARPLWALGVVVMLAFAIVPPLVFVARTDATAIVKRELQQSGKMEQLTAEQREQAISLGAKGTKILLPIGAAVKRSLWMTILTLVCLGLLKGSRPELKMSPVAGAVAVAMAPLAVHDVLVAATFLFKDPMQLDATNAVLSNPAAWLGFDAGHSVAGAALRGLDFFELWACWLVGLGVNVVANSRSSLPYVVAFGGHVLATLMNMIGPALR